MTAHGRVESVHDGPTAVTMKVESFTAAAAVGGFADFARRIIVIRQTLRSAPNGRQ